MDRPSRKTKSVNYCESKDHDDDEDFAIVKAPASKKIRESGKQEARSNSKPSSQDSQSTTSQQSRKPLDERLHERDLEAAVVLSLLNNSNDRKDQAKGNGVAKVQVVADENTDPMSLHLSNCSVDSAVLGLDGISSEKESLSKQRKAAAKAAEESRTTLKDEDYEPKVTSESESEEDFSEPGESEDEEFAVKNFSKTKKKAKDKSGPVKAAPASKKVKPVSKPATSKSPGRAAATTPVRSPPIAKVVSKRPPSSSSVAASRPAVSPSPAGGRVPKWNPPGQVGRSPSSSQTPAVRSPGQGLRLGLSRRVRVKPLHPSVASH